MRFEAFRLALRAKIDFGLRTRTCRNAKLAPHSINAGVYSNGQQRSTASTFTRYLRHRLAMPYRAMSTVKLRDLTPFPRRCCNRCAVLLSQVPCGVIFEVNLLGRPTWVFLLCVCCVAFQSVPAYPMTSHSIEDVADSGKVLVLDDDSVWGVEDVDAVDSSVWVDGDDLKGSEKQ